MTGPDDRDARVRAQYEAYPYPSRDPADERRRLITGSPSHLLEIDHYLFAARRDPARRLRVLFAGGGTGDGTIMLAQQLAERGAAAEITYLDVSTAARAVAEARARARGLDSIRFVTGSLLDAPALGRFDYVDCCGVLHHLEDPAAGLAALVAALDDEGGIGLMVYGTYGRTGVYPLQHLLRLLAGPEADDGARVALARRTVAALPETNLFRRNPFLADHLGSDAGLYDLLLHSRDRAYRVPELLALLDGAGLRPVTFIEPARYDPATYLTDAVLLKRVAALDDRARWAAAELLSTAMKVHIVYAVKAGRPDPVVASMSDDAILALRDLDGAAVARSIKPGAPLVARFDGVQHRLPLPRLAGAILARIDGRRSVAALRALVRAEVDSRLTDEAVGAAVAETVSVFLAINRIAVAGYTTRVK